MLDVDAGNFAVGTVLQQEQGCSLRVIGYSSRVFNPCERRYCITRKKLAAIVFGLKQYRQYLLGRHFLIRSDHVALTYLRSAKELIGQQARWLDFIEEFDFELQHRAGTVHGNADALSRKDSPDLAALSECNQCRKRDLMRQDKQNGIDACQSRDNTLPFWESSAYQSQGSTWFLPEPSACQSRGSAWLLQKHPGRAIQSPSSSTGPMMGHAYAATTRAQEHLRKEVVLEPSAPATPAETTPRRAKRRLQQEKDLQHALEPWTAEWLRSGWAPGCI